MAKVVGNGIRLTTGYPKHSGCGIGTTIDAND